MELTVALRFLERIVSVLIAGVSVYLGYRLFLSLPDKADSNGKMVLPGNISIYLSRVGPGAFFALFGACILALSFAKGVSFSKAEQDVLLAGTDKQTSLAETFSGVTGTKRAVAPEDLEAMRANAKGDLLQLARLPSALRSDSPAVADICSMIPRLKLAVLSRVWGQDWGSLASFERWVYNGSRDPPPEGQEEPARLFSCGQ
ncbi:MAG: hypothetical protein GXP31_13370 [Kiritimatiellaeota bacterium]|nr:hypothetical protein [Kiritimatiellota bacterium]